MGCCQVRLFKGIFTRAAAKKKKASKRDVIKIEKHNKRWGRQAETKRWYLKHPDSRENSPHTSLTHTRLKTHHHPSTPSHWGHVTHVCETQLSFWIEEDRAHTFSIWGEWLGLQRKGSDVGAQHLDGAQHPGGGLQGGEGWTGWAELFRL